MCVMHVAGNGGRVFCSPVGGRAGCVRGWGLSSRGLWEDWGGGRGGRLLEARCFC